MASRVENTKRNIIWGSVNKATILVMPFASRTALIYVLGLEYVGLSGLFTSLLSALSLAELGFGSALVYSMYKPLANEDYDTIGALLAFYKRCYRVIGLLIAVFGIALIPALPHLVHGDCPSDINLQTLYCIYLLNSVLSYLLFAYKTSLFTASQRLDVTSNISSVLAVLSSLLQISLLILFRNYYLYALVLPLITCVNNCAIAFFFKKRFPGIKAKGKIRKDELRAIASNIKSLIVLKVGNTLLNSIDSVMVSATLGLSVLGLYNNYMYIVTSLFGFLGIVQNSLIPAVGNAIALKTKEECKRDFDTLSFIYLWIVGWWTCCLLILVQPFMYLWLGEQGDMPISFVVSLACYFYVYKMYDICYVFREAAGIWESGRFVPLIASAVKIPLGIALLHVAGINGILIASIVTVVIIHFPGFTRPLFTVYFDKHTEWLDYVGMQVGRAIVVLIISGLCYRVSLLIPDGGLLWLIIKGAYAAIVPNVLFFCVLRRSVKFDEAFKFVLSLLKK